MKLNIFKKIGAAVIALTLILVSLNILLTEPVSTNNTMLITGRFKAIRENKPSRGSLNYNLYIQDDSRLFKIGANDADCFFYDTFIEEVKENQIIKLYIRKNNGFLMNPNISFIASVVANDKNYLDFDCVNENLRNEKIYFPLFSLLIIVGFLIYRFELKKIKGRKKEQAF